MAASSSDQYRSMIRHVKLVLAVETRTVKTRVLRQMRANCVEYRREIEMRARMTSTKETLRKLQVQAERRLGDVEVALVSAHV